jgi:hypothetical protein
MIMNELKKEAIKNAPYRQTDTQIEYLEECIDRATLAERQRCLTEITEAKKAWLERWEGDRLPKDTLASSPVVAAFFDMAIDAIKES